MYLMKGTSGTCSLSELVNIGGRALSRRAFNNHYGVFACTNRGFQYLDYPALERMGFQKVGEYINGAAGTVDVWFRTNIANPLPREAAPRKRAKKTAKKRVSKR